MTARTFCLAASVSFLLCWMSLPAIAAWTGNPGPHDSAHLVVVGAADFRSDSSKPLELLKETGAAFNGQAIRVARPALAKLHVRHAGTYTLIISVPDRCVHIFDRNEHRFCEIPKREEGVANRVLNGIKWE